MSARDACRAALGIARGVALGVMLCGAARAEPFLRIPSAPITAVAGASPQAALLDLRAPRWVLGGLTGPAGTGVSGAHASLAFRGARGGVQLGVSSLGTSFYRESRACVAFGGVRAGALAILLDARRARVGRRVRAGLGLGLAGRVGLGIFELSVAVGPEGRTGERALFPALVRGDVRVSAGGRGLRLGIEALGDGAPAVELAASWRGGAWRVETGVDLVAGALRVALGVSGPAWVHVERRAAFLSGDWTSAALSGRPGGGDR